jgi:hypothetical protein
MYILVHPEWPVFRVINPLKLTKDEIAFPNRLIDIRSFDCIYEFINEGDAGHWEPIESHEDWFKEELPEDQSVRDLLQIDEIAGTAI